MESLPHVFPACVCLMVDMGKTYLLTLEALRSSRTDFGGEIIGLFVRRFVFCVVMAINQPSRSICSHFNLAMSPIRWPPV